MKALEFRSTLRLARTGGSEFARDGWPPSGATPAHLRAINARKEVLTTLTDADVFVRSMDAINDLPLKNGLRLESAGLFAIAGLAAGAPVLCNHDTGALSGPPGLPVGRVFAARSARRGTATWVEMDFWMPAIDDNAALVKRIDTGAISEVSVSFGYESIQCSVCSSDWTECDHWPGEVYKGKTCEAVITGVHEFYEVSLVWQGMANGTRLKMAAGRFDASGDIEAAFPDKPRRHRLAGLFAPKPDQSALEVLFKK